VLTPNGYAALTLDRLGPDGPSGRLADKNRVEGSFADVIEVGGTGSVKKLFILALLVLGAFAVWRKVQAQRADLDLWSEATAPDDY
jgi:hypothetical protein